MVARMNTSSGAHLVLVEDDEDIRRLVADLLSREGFTVEAVSGGQGLDGVLARRRPDLVILDLMLPGEDGLSLCRRLTARGGPPILMLTAKAGAIDRVVGLEMGADDYLTKPFEPRELLARVRAILRRTRGGPLAGTTRRYGFEGYVIDLDARTLVSEGGAAVPLTGAEFDLLACFVLHPRRVLSRDQLLDWTRGRQSFSVDRAIDMTVSRLRKKLDSRSPGAAFISTVRNNGYLFVPPVRQL